MHNGPNFFDSHRRFLLIKYVIQIYIMDTEFIYRGLLNKSNYSYYIYCITLISYTCILRSFVPGAQCIPNKSLGDANFWPELCWRRRSAECISRLTGSHYVQDSIPSLTTALVNRCTPISWYFCRSDNTSVRKKHRLHSTIFSC